MRSCTPYGIISTGFRRCPNMRRWLFLSTTLLFAAGALGAQSPAGSDVDRANNLVREVTTTLATARTAARDARLEKSVAALDALPDACCLDQKITAHSAVNKAYRKAGVPTRLGKHSLWLIDAAARLNP